MPNRVAPELDLEYLRTRFWSNVNTVEDSECWSWKQSAGSHGYGQTWDKRSVRLAHRVAWELTYGTIPDGLTVDHRCRNRKCCNPNHLRLLTNEANGRENGNFIKTHCPKGHSYEGANLYVDPKGGRRCRECARNRRMKWRSTQ